MWPIRPSLSGLSLDPLASVNFWLHLRNSLVVATVTTVCQVFFSAMVAYAFAGRRGSHPLRSC